MRYIAVLCAAFSVGLALPALAEPAQSEPARFEHFAYEGRSQEQAKAGPDEYLNPILPGYYPDPSVTRVGDDYYLVNSSFAHFPGLPVFHSRDLIHWTQIANAINRPEQLDFDGLRVSRGVFAPDISYHNGLFYIVNTCVDCKGNFVITAKDPTGPWSDPVWFDFEGIDPSIFWDDDGKAYIVNNGAPNETPRYEGHRAIWVQEFDHKTLKLVGERTQIVNGGVDISQKPIWIEGPHLLRKDGYYYLTAAEGGTGDQHSQVVLRARSVRGPFVPYDKNPILSQRTLDPARKNPVTSAGHAKLVQTQNGEWWATFLATRPYGPDLYNIGRETFLLPVTWKDGWPVILEDGKAIPFTAPKPNLPPQASPVQPINGDFRYDETFDSQALPLSWIGVRTPRAPVYRLDKGALILNPGAVLGDLNGTPAFIARRQQHHVANVSTALTYRPQKDGDRAGLAALQNDDAWLFFGVTRLNGKAHIALYARENTKTERLIASVPLDAREVTLTLRLDGGRLTADYATGGQTRTLTKDVDITFLSTRKAGGFVGTLIGLYAFEVK